MTPVTENSGTQTSGSTTMANIRAANPGAQIIYVKKEDSTTLVLLGALGAIMTGILIYGIIYIVRKFTTHPNVQNAKHNMVDKDPHTDRNMDDATVEMKRMQKMGSQTDLRDQFDPTQEFHKMMKNSAQRQHEQGTGKQADNLVVPMEAREHSSIVSSKPLVAQGSGQKLIGEKKDVSSRRKLQSPD